MIPSPPSCPPCPPDLTDGALLRLSEALSLPSEGDASPLGQGSSPFTLPFLPADPSPGMGEKEAACGIGERSEKLLHRLLKCCYAPNPSNREVKIGRFIADVYDSGQVVEIQTGNPGCLLPKLREFLRLGLSVTLVCPLASVKILYWVDPSTGSLSKGRKSCKKERPLDALPLLYPLRELLLSPRFRVELLSFSLSEYRLQNGYAREGKKGSSRLERIPLCLLERRTLRDSSDYLRIFEEVEGLPPHFTAGDLQKAAKLRSRPAYGVIHLLSDFGLLLPAEKRKTAQTWTREHAGENETEKEIAAFADSLSPAIPERN